MALFSQFGHNGPLFILTLQPRHYNLTVTNLASMVDLFINFGTYKTLVWSPIIYKTYNKI